MVTKSGSGRISRLDIWIAAQPIVRLAKRRPPPREALARHPTSASLINSGGRGSRPSTGRGVDHAPYSLRYRYDRA